MRCSVCGGSGQGQRRERVSTGVHGIEMPRAFCEGPTCAAALFYWPTGRTATPRAESPELAAQARTTTLVQGRPEGTWRGHSNRLPVDVVSPTARMTLLAFR